MRFLDTIVGVGSFSMVIAAERRHSVTHKNVESAGDVTRARASKRRKDVESRCVIVGGCDHNRLLGLWKRACSWSGKQNLAIGFTPESRLREVSI